MAKRIKAVINPKVAKKISILKCPWDPMSNEAVAYAKKNEVFVYDPDVEVYDWQGHKYYAVVKDGVSGYMRAEAISQ